MADAAAENGRQAEAAPQERSGRGPTSSASPTRAGLRVLGVAIRREPRMFAIATTGSLLFGALTVADAWVLGWSTEHVVLPALRDGEIAPTMLFAVVALFVGVALLRAVGIVTRRVGAGIMQYRMEAHDRKAVTRRYLELPMEWHHRHPTGVLLSNANSDVQSAWTPIAPLPMAVGTIAMMVVAIAQMFFSDVVLALIGLLVFPAVIGLNVWFQRLSAPLMTRVQQLRGEVSEIAHESFDAALVVKTLGREDAELARLAPRNEELRDVAIRAGKIRGAFDPVLTALPTFALLGVIVVGALRVDAGLTSTADVVTIAYLLTVIAFPIRSIGWLLGDLPRSVVGFDRVRRVLAEQASIDHGAEPAPRGRSGARLTLRDVGFAYDQRPVIDALDADVEAGRTVAVVGATGSGKSTLVHLLARLMDPDDGRIALDDLDLRALRPGALADVVAVVPQTAFLFDDTVRGNVALDAEVEDATIWAALATAQASDFVQELPQGLDTPLGERGATLSGGQRQRLSLARALLRQPRLLVLDDATSAVDPHVEQEILQALRAGSSDSQERATLILIAYRKATIALADEVWFLHDGRVRARGTHEDLHASDPLYRDLVDAYERDAEGALS